MASPRVAPGGGAPRRLDYPEVRRDDTVETLHGHVVPDPYRWLEDPGSEDTRAWVAAQNELTAGHLEELASRPWFLRHMTALVQRPRAGTPDIVAGRYYVVSRNDGTLQQDQWFVAESLDELREGGRLLLDPNTFSDDGTSSLGGYDASRDGRWLAYQVSDGGSDWSTIRMLELATGAETDDVVTHVKFSEAVWLPDHASYLYVHYPTPTAATGTATDALPGGRLMRHRLGTPQAEDQLVLEFPDDPRMHPEAKLSHDGRWLVVHVIEGTDKRNRLWVYPVETTGGASRLGEPLRVVDEARAAFRFVRTAGDHLYLHTDVDAPRGRVVRCDLAEVAATGRVRFADVVDETEATLQSATAVGEEILTVHLADAQPRITRFSLDGDRVGTVEIEAGSVLAVNGDVGCERVVVGVATVTEPVRSYLLDLGTGTLSLIKDLTPGGSSAWVAPEVVTVRRRATSDDGTEVPYFLVRRADVTLEEPRPTMLYGYGGFDIPILADFRVVFAGWLAAGGVLAIANLRGGGEYGTEWYDAGRLRAKQNVFDDFAAVAEHLMAEGVTTSDRLALHGGSNGGLLVGATLTQRPGLAAVALPAVGVFDMLRFHRFTIGSAWTTDFGSPEDPDDFARLLAYSPLHNVEEGTSYPATLVVTGDHDDRVVPAHSFKMVSALQHAQGGEAPVLARIETSTGHGPGKPASVIAAEAADLLAFAAEHTGLVPNEG